MTEHWLYGGLVRLAFDEKAHKYLVSVNGREGEEWPSVTSLLSLLDKSGPLVGWSLKEAAKYVDKRLKKERVEGFSAGSHVWTADDDGIQSLCDGLKRAPRSKKEWAADVGTQAHAWIEAHIKAQLELTEQPELPTDKWIRQACESFLKWEDFENVKYLASERRVASLDYRYVGTMDQLIQLNGKLTVLDTKASNAIYPEYHLQAAAYAAAVEEEDDCSIEQHVIVRISKDGPEVEAQLIEYTDEARRLMGTVAHLATLYGSLNGAKGFIAEATKSWKL